MPTKERIPDPRPDQIALRTIAGSRLHGTALPGVSDRDEAGFYVEDAQQVIGFVRSHDTWHYRNTTERARSDASTVEGALFSLRQFLALSLAGNPSVLQVAFTPAEFIIDAQPIAHEAMEAARSLCQHRSAGRRYLGYLDSQMARLDGVGHVARMPKRPELIEAHGFDCYADDTEFLTPQGWRTYDRISSDESLATINQTTHRVEFQRPTDRVSKPYSGEMYECETTATSWMVTSNHRMFASKALRGASGALGDAYRAADADWRFFRMDEMASGLTWHVRVAAEAPVDEPLDVADDYLSLMGAYVSEGCVGKRLRDGSASVIRIEQKDGGRLHGIIDLVSRTFPLRSYRYPDKRPVTIWTLADREIAKRLENDCGNGSWHKRLPSWVYLLSARQVDVLLGAMLAGDGTPHRSGGWVYYSVSKELADGLQAMLVYSGRRATVWGPYTYAGKQSAYQVRIHDRDTPTVVPISRAKSKMQKKAVSGVRVVCFTVPNETLVTRRNGKVAMHGNTKYVAHALRLAHQGLELMGTGRLTLPLPVGVRERVLAVRRGERTEAEARAEVADVRERLERAIATVDLPEYGDVDDASRHSVRLHEAFWASHCGGHD